MNGERRKEEEKKKKKWGEGRSIVSGRRVERNGGA